MRVLVFADFRSPHAIGWADGLEAGGIDVLRVSSIGEVGDTAATGARSSFGIQMARRLSTRAGHHVRTAEALARQWSRQQVLRSAIGDFGPDLVHALRLPYEGVAALTALRSASIPVVVSTWGQDFAAQAASDAVLRRWIRRTLPSAAGLVVDVPDDLERGRAFGLADVPTLVAAANFGILPAKERDVQFAVPTVTYTRGLTTHVDYEAFVQAIPIVLSRARSGIQFVGVGLADLPSARRIAGDPEFATRVVLTPKVDSVQFAQLLKRSTATCSPAVSDGMPLSVLQSLAEGCTTLVGPLPQYAEIARQTPQMKIMRGTDAESIAEAVLELDAAWASGPPVARSEPFVPPIYDRRRNAEVVPEFYDRVLHSWSK